MNAPIRLHDESRNQIEAMTESAAMASVHPHTKGGCHGLVVDQKIKTKQT